MIWKLRTDRSCHYDIVSWNDNEGLTIADFVSVSFTLRVDQICFMIYTDPFAFITRTWRSFEIFSLLFTILIMKLT